MHLTQSVVDRLKPPQGVSDFWVPDDAMSGFGIRFRNGHGVYCVRYSLGGRDRRLTYSRIDRVTLAMARAWAKVQFGSVAERIDPVLERAKAEAKNVDTIGRHIPAFLEFMRQSGRAEEYIKATRRSLEEYFSTLHPYHPEDVTRAMVAKALTAIREGHGSVAGDRARASLSSLFGWLAREGIYEGVNPVLGTVKIGAPSRDRVLNATELRAVWNALSDNDDYSSILRLLILLGARKNEIALLSWSEVNWEAEQLELDGARTKNRKPHLIPLSSSALAILQQRPRTGDCVFGRLGTGFSGWSTCKARLDAKVPITPSWTVHDLRRTFSTVAHERLEIAPHVVEAILGHARGGTVAATYNRAAYLEQRRAALIRYSEYIASAVAP